MAALLAPSDEWCNVRTMRPPTVGLAIIARDEETHLPRLLASAEGAFDQVVLLDTGSQDRTVEVFQAWARAQTGVTYRVGRFDWTDDFAAARNAADALLTTDWRCWADCDDTIEGAETLRQLAANAPAQVAAMGAEYDYARDEHDNVVCVLRRERLVRAGCAVWEGRVHEAQTIQGAIQIIDRGVVRWVHHKPPEAGVTANERNLAILTAWQLDEPCNPRVLAYLGTETAARGEMETAEKWFRACLAERTGWNEERAQVHRKLATVLIAQNRLDEAMDVALAAERVCPGWPDSALSMAEVFYAAGEWEKAITKAHDVLRLGQPDSLLILNPMDYLHKPKVLLAAALGALGRVDSAIIEAEHALAMCPSHQELQRHLAGWRATSKREHVASTIVAMAGLLVEHDEQLKALALLEDAVPCFAQDHPAVVACRSEVRERILWAKDPAAYARHYREDGSKPEDMIEDDRIGALCDTLPRAAFALAGLADQAACRLHGDLPVAA